MGGWWVGDRDGMVLETPCGEKTSKFLKFYFIKNENGATSGEVCDSVAPPSG